MPCSKRAQRLGVAPCKVQPPERLQYLLRVEPHFVALVVNCVAGIHPVEATINTQLVSTGLLLRAESLDDQFGKAQRASWRPTVAPAGEAQRTAGRRLELVPIEPVRIHPVPQLAVKHVARRLARQIVQIRKLPEQALGHLGERNGFFDIHVTWLPDSGRTITAASRSDDAVSLYSLRRPQVRIDWHATC
ncbi:hypothetical protein D3C76_931250 [compost metagenome]